MLISISIIIGYFVVGALVCMILIPVTQRHPRHDALLIVFWPALVVLFLFFVALWGLDSARQRWRR